MHACLITEKQKRRGHRNYNAQYIFLVSADPGAEEKYTKDTSSRKL